jgi:DNA-binding response OmpR family regulator
MPTPGRRRVLIVDDAPEIRAILGSLLSEEEYLVSEAADGATAVAAMVEDPLDLVLLDLSLPDMEGYEVCARIHAMQKCRSTPIIFISGHDDSRTRVRCFEAGGVDYVPKPFVAAEVLARVRHHLLLRELQRHLAERTIQLERELEDERTANAALMHDRDRLADRLGRLEAERDLNDFS